VLAPVSFTVYTEKAPGAGEDAPPLLISAEDAVAVGVFDGMGGAGALAYDHGDQTRSGAWLASRAVLKTVAMWLRRNTELVVDSKHVIQLASVIQTDLQELHELLGSPGTRVRSKLIRTLPTTLALAIARRQPAANGVINVQAIWAGDSRVYALTPQGLHQLTRDDSKSKGDALENLVDDSPMSNCISADRPFELHQYDLDLAQPFLLFAATDGCFGYVDSPMHLEHLILDALRRAQDWPREWADQLRSDLLKTAGDDATLALAGLGFADLGEAQRCFAPRGTVVREELVAPLAATGDARAFRQLRERLWEGYKQSYEHYQPGEPDAQG